MMKFMLFSTARPSAKPHRFHNGKSRSQVPHHHDAEHKQHGTRVLPDAEVGIVGNGNTGKDRHPHADHRKGQQGCILWLPLGKDRDEVHRQQPHQ